MVLNFEPISPDSTPDRSQLEGLRDERKSNPGLLSSLKNLGRNREEQIQKNQAAMARAKERLRELEEKRGLDCL